MMKETQSRLALVCLALALPAGCAPGSSARVQQPAPSVISESETASRQDIVTADELQARGEVGTSAWDALRRVRPEFLTRRATPLPDDPYDGYPVVYLDGQRLGGLSSLQGIPLSSILEIRFMRAPAALERVGKSHPGGVIAVRTRR